MGVLMNFAHSTTPVLGMVAKAVNNTATTVASDKSKFSEMDNNSTPDYVEYNLSGNEKVVNEVHVVQPASLISQIIYLVFSVLAIYMVYKCSKIGKVSVIELIAAFCCAPFYVAYRIIKPCKPI